MPAVHGPAEPPDSCRVPVAISTYEHLRTAVLVERRHIRLPALLALLPWRAGKPRRVFRVLNSFLG